MSENNVENQEDNHVVDDVDTSLPEPVENAPQQPQSEDEDVEEGGEMNHMDNSGEVIGRQNKDLPTENLSVPDATS